jgi:hypothetical protein
LKQIDFDNAWWVSLRLQVTSFETLAKLLASAPPVMSALAAESLHHGAQSFYKRIPQI